jgi:hypothetical protein
LEIKLSTDQNSEEKEEKKIHELLPFWTRELLAMKKEAEREDTVHEPSVREGS